MLDSSTLSMLSASAGLRRLEAQVRLSVSAVQGTDPAVLAANREAGQVLLEASQAAERIETALRRVLLDIQA